MKLEQLRKIIREEVRAAVKEELQEMLTEAVKVASTPGKNPTTEYQTVPTNMKKRWSAPMAKNKTIEEMLQMTKATFTSQDAQQFTGAGTVNKPNFASNQATQLGMAGAEPGIDISKLDFVLESSNANNVYKLEEIERSHPGASEDSYVMEADSSSKKETIPILFVYAFFAWVEENVFQGII